MWPFGEIDFVVDERPVEVGERSIATHAADAVDLVGQLTALLAENERMSGMLDVLKQAGSGEDEMEKVVRRMLPVLDGFERLLAVGRDFPDDHAITNWLRSVEGLYFRLKNLLEGLGLFGMEAVGQPVNLDVHEVVEYRYSPDYEPETVIAVRQRGYVFRGHLIRDAQVVVATNERS